MKITNNTNLPYKIIGEFIDDCIKRNEVETLYYGKVDYFTIGYKDRLYKVQIRYLKRYTEWRFDYYKHD